MDNRIGKLFPPPAIFGGYSFWAFGFIAIFLIHAENSWWIGLILIFVGAIWVVPYTGILFSEDTKQYKEYIDVFGFKFGTWKTREEYPFIAIMLDREGWVVRGSPNDQGNFSEKYYDVCLLNKTHHDQILVKRYQKVEDAKAEISTLATQLGVTEIVYHPAHSTGRRR
jgi:hypothetical protein